MRQLPECLAALLPQLPPDSELILVDNGSTDGTAAWARVSYPQARVIALPRNLGFAGGVNAGLRAMTVADAEESATGGVSLGRARRAEYTVSDWKFTAASSTP